VSHALEERLRDLGADVVAAHHGSLSRQIRLSAEERLKSGKTRVVVATASLELGIDIGAVDLVCQIGSPRAIATGLQRVGRAGHWIKAIPKGRLFVMTRDDLLECAALIRAIRTGILDRIAVPPAPLDILAQQLVAAAATQTWQEDELFDLCRRADPYRALTRSEFDQVLRMAADGIATNRGRGLAYLFHDRINRRVKGRRGARLAAITSGGAIPDTANYAVVAEPEGTVVGSVDEDFAVESLAGDIMLLGNTSWRIKGVEMGKVRVEDAHGAPPNIPFWRGEAPSRTAELSAELVFGLISTTFLRQPPYPLPLMPHPFNGFDKSVPWISVVRNRLSSMSWQARLYLGSSRRSRQSWQSGSSTKAAGCSWSCTRHSGGGSTGPGASPCGSGSA
jgi:ATP-dependent helicase Lhr and Lhr-like helicase